MMQKLLFLSIIIMVFLVACDQQDTQEELPTVMPTVTLPEPTPTQEVVATATTVERPTLPPSWTPTDEPVTPTATETPETQVEAPVEVNDVPEACGPFGPDTSITQEQIVIGETATIGWRPVEGAGSYWIVIFDPSENSIHERFLTELSYEIPWEVFGIPARYGWEARPLDADGIQMCEARGGRIIVRPAS